MKIYPNGTVIPLAEGPEVGDAMYFNDVLSDDEERQIVTSRIESIERLLKEIVAQYPIALSA